MSRRLAALSTELATVAGEDTRGPVGGPPELPRPVVVPTPGRHASRRAGSALWTRLPLTSAHLAVLALVAAVALAASAWWVVRAQARPEPLPAPGALTSAADPLVTPASGSAAAPAAAPARTEEVEQVTVDVAGKVRDPGIAVLPAGSRVIDAIEAAGGVPRRVDLTSLNLARVLVDGEQVLVAIAPPTAVGAAAAAGSAGATGALVDLNTADASALDTLPGVGPVTAESILSWRDQHGSFTSVEELLEVDGIGAATLADIAPHVTL